jgi:hypothetical protein
MIQGDDPARGSRPHSGDEHAKEKDEVHFRVKRFEGAQASEPALITIEAIPGAF